MKRFIDWVFGFGAKGDISAAAPTQLVTTSPASSDINAEKPCPGPLEIVTPCNNVTGFVPKAKDKLLDRWLDVVVRVSGSEPIFLAIVIGIFAWAFLGIRFGTTENWAIIISDVQAIISYIFDSFLMRQQLNEYARDIRVAAMLMSRAESHKRMVREIVGGGRYRMFSQMEIDDLHRVAPEAELPPESLLGRVSTFLSTILGHIVTCGLYWVCIFVWIGFGQYCGWSNEWQLYINSSTSALMLLIFAFLANIQERHGAHIDKCLDTIFQVDSAIEIKLRTITGDILPNELVTIPGPTVGRLQRGINYYSDLVGTLTGIAILMLFIVTWIALGPVLSFSPNWWLIIGTYCGLIGMNDGFVLDNVQSRLHSYVDEAFEQVHFSDIGLFDDIRAPGEAESQSKKMTISQRLSLGMSAICSHPYTVIFGVLSILGLLAGATAMGWDTAGQLLCNIPPSIIETFFMMVMITGHNLSDERRRADLQTMYLRRLKILTWAKELRLTESE